MSAPGLGEIHKQWWVDNQPIFRPSGESGEPGALGTQWDQGAGNTAGFTG
jgi:hypothetical protein